MSEPKVPCFDGQYFFDPDVGGPSESWRDSLPRLNEWIGNRHNTSATLPTIFDLEHYERVKVAFEALSPPIPEVVFYEAPGGGVVAMAGESYLGWLSDVHFEEFKRRLEGQAPLGPGETR